MNNKINTLIALHLKLIKELLTLCCCLSAITLSAAVWFRITAKDDEGIIGEGEHLRFIVGKEKFMSKIIEK